MVDVDLATSWLDSSDHVQPMKLYVRTACIDLWKHLESTKHRVSFVTGCPGVGKSVEVYAYAMWQATVHKKRILYIHCHDESISLTVTAGAGSTGARFGHVSEYTDSFESRVLRDFIYSSLEKREVDLIVLDGQLSRLIKSVFLKLQKYRDVRMISCTSFQALTKLST